MLHNRGSTGCSGLYFNVIVKYMDTEILDSRHPSKVSFFYIRHPPSEYNIFHFWIIMMTLHSVKNSFRLVTAHRTLPGLNDLHQTSGKGVLSKLARVFNSIFPLGKQNSYTLREMNISSPIGACVPASVFSVIPEKLQRSCKDGMITVDRNYFLKDKIHLLASVDCSRTGTQLPENKDAPFELIDSGISRKEYRCKNWDYTPPFAWD